MKTIICALLLTALAFGQSKGIVSEAKDNLAQKRHKALVEKTERFLAAKAECEARLAEINRKLEKLDAGEDVKDDLGSGMSAEEYVDWIRKNAVPSGYSAVR